MSTVAHADDTTFDSRGAGIRRPGRGRLLGGVVRTVPRRRAPELEALATEHGDALKVVKVDVDAAPGIAGRYGIRGIPTIALFRDGAQVDVDGRRQAEACDRSRSRPRRADEELTMQSFDTTIDAPLEEVEPKVRAALQEQGFGVLTEIDVAATLRAKLGVERPALKILGACNPEFAHVRSASIRR